MARPQRNGLHGTPPLDAKDTIMRLLSTLPHRKETSCNLVQVSTISVGHWRGKQGCFGNQDDLALTSHVRFLSALRHWWSPWRLILPLSERLVQPGLEADRASKIPYNG
jgi:hypothetical protein